MTSRQFQSLLFEKVRAEIPEHESMIDHLTEVLSISRDSGYRRLRNETALTFDEAITLSRRFNISLNSIAGHSENTAVFQRQRPIQTYEDYLQHNRNSLAMLEKIRSCKGHSMTYSAKDIPIFYQFAFPKLAAFKMYVWMKSLYDIPTIEGENYSMDKIPQELLELARKQWIEFSQINTREIWNDTTVLSLINQICYYYEAGLVAGPEEALALCDEFEAMMKVIYKQALSGEKVHANNPEVKSGASCAIYYHEILIMNNHILAELPPHANLYFIPTTGISYMHTADPALIESIQGYLLSQTKKSALISDVSEKERNRFFLKIKSKINHLRQRIESTEPLV